ncbi:hypothetical protein NEILACOT_03058 [Neisseria lactamica ATCC 23970]|uniref:Uncharacterized protein n=1 Tax=Neisseria lactamica ATCC 23970 TaxID=546265 RepID=D0W6C2_NEILA|nr:hypothetical protein NEILACOT_03058 [Neisseria lactamica ATCC 23970]
MKPANNRRHSFFQKFTLCHILTKAYLPDNAESQTHFCPLSPTTPPLGKPPELA